MILKLKMKDDSRKNIEIIKSHFFDASDKITAGYIIGMAVERTDKVSDSEWKNAINSVLYENGTSGKSTSVSLRQEVFERISKIKEKLQDLCGKSLYMSQVIDVILFVVVSKLNPNVWSLSSLTVMEWNVNARAGSADHVMPVNLIVNEIFDKDPHIFVLTEFVKSVGWIDFKTILEDRYDVFDSSYLVRQNGICIGVRKECEIEYLEAQTRQSAFGLHLNAPDFYEIKVRMNSQVISVIGTRIRIDYRKTNSKKSEERLYEQKQRFEQYIHLVKYISQIENVIVLGDFNHSRILSDEKELDHGVIDKMYSGKDSVEYNFQKMRASVMEATDRKVLLYTPDGDGSSIGASWNSKAGEAIPPAPKSDARHKYDHLLTDFVPEKLEYRWDFLKFYDSTQFAADGKIAVGYPDHAILLGKIKINNTL